MEKFTYLFILIVLSVSETRAQENKQPVTYKVPAAYHFDYKVKYEINNEEKKTAEKMTYYFTKSGDYMSMEPPKSEKDNEKFMVNTKDGLMITFSEESSHSHKGENSKVITVMDMRSMLKGMGKGLEDIAKTLPKKDKADVEKKKPNEMDNFKKTGKTKQIFGYTAEEYSKEFTKDEKGNMHSGTMSVWYAKVDFDPEMMFSMGMGNMAGKQSQSKMQQLHANNMMGLGMTQKNYLLIEMNFAEKGGKSGTAMKVVNIEKTSFSKSTDGYYVKNYSGMSMKEMMQKESAEK
jgi:hypothetical protein